MCWLTVPVEPRLLPGRPLKKLSRRWGFSNIIYFSPSVPLSLKGEGEEIERGAFAPLKTNFSFYQ
jgi:hypothetical protein